MKKLLLTSLIACSILLGACKKMLDTKPQDFLSPDTYFNKEADATAALGAAWDMLTRQWMYSGYYNYRALTSDDCWTALSPSFASNLGLTASDATFYPIRWNNLYATIQYCNILLANLPRIPMDETRKGIIKGEALFLRAFIYFELVKDWGPVPVRLTPTNGPNDLNLAGTPVKDIYTQIIKDMTEAEGLVPTAAVNQYGGAGYAAKTTVQAMLARVNLHMAGFPVNDVSKYQAAKEWAQKVVESQLHALNPDFTQVFKNMAAGVIDKKESLWEVDFNFVSGASAESGSVGYLDGILGASVPFGAASGQYKITRKLFVAYGGTTASTKDLRRDWTCAPWTWKNLTTTGADIDKTFFTSTQIYQRFEAKFRLEYCPQPNVSAGQSPINFPLMRYADVLLMLAEAENYLNGPTPLAYSCINQVRARAWVKLMPGATNLTEADVPAGLSKDAFLQELQNERLREFAGEGLRKFDLIRWGIFISSIKALGPDVLNPANGAPVTTTGGQPYPNMLQLANTVSTRDLLWPMPASELQYNKLLKQNPGW
jgi:hypothetical protein